MELDPDKIYSMPLIMGAVFDRDARPGRVYGEVESLSATFLTDPSAARALVPDCFLIPEQATVTVTFGDYNRVDFMAGDGYRVAYVGVSAKYEGEETVDGLCILVMWENRTLPIIGGREMIGIPKGYADITSIRTVKEDRLRATASVWGHEVMRLEVVGGREQNLMVRRTAQKRVNATPWLGYKYIPSFDGLVEFGTADESDLDLPAAVTRALRSLPIGDLVFAAHTKGSAVLRLDRSRRLR